MQIDGWKYYNHAVIPTTAPHITPAVLPSKNSDIWKIGGATPLLARWTTDFDCGHKTNWWYVIKDTPFDIAEVKAKRRYEINKGIKNFYVVEIDPLDYKEELYKVQIDAFSAYPEKYRPTVERRSFYKSIDKWGEYSVIAAFHRDTDELCGYALLSKANEGYIDFTVLKTKPQYEKFSVNAALVEGIMRQFNDFLEKGGYICDGARNINHETGFQDYLEKYFGFRKAYCKLHIEYRPKLKGVIKLLYPFRKIFLTLDGVGKIHQLNSVLKMEEICRSGDAE